MEEGDAAPTLVPTDAAAVVPLPSAADAPPCPFALLERQVMGGVIVCSSASNALLSTLTGIVRGLCRQDSSAASAAVLAHLTQLFCISSKLPTVPVLLCGLAATTTVLCLKALHSPTKETLRAAAGCLAAICGHQVPVQKLPAIPGLEGIETGRPVVARHVSVPSGAMRSAAYAAAKGYLSTQTMEEVLTHFVATWGSIDESVDGYALHIAAAFECTPGPLVAAAMLRAQNGEGAQTRDVLAAILNISLGAPPSVQGMHDAVDVARRWVVLAHNGEGGLGHIPYALDVLAAGADAQGETASTGVAMVATAVAASGTQHVAGPRREWWPTYEEAMDDAALSGRVFDVESAEVEDAVVGDNDAELFSKAMRWVADVLTKEPNEADAVAASGLGYAVSFTQLHEKLGLEQLELLLQVIARLTDTNAAQLQRGASDSLTALLKALLGTPSPLPSAEHTLDLLLRHHLKKDGLLSRSIPWPILHIGSVAVSRLGQREAVKSLMDSLWDGLCTAVTEGEHPAFDVPVVSFLHLICTTYGDAAYNTKLTGKLARALQESASQRNYGVKGQCVRLMHILLLPPDNVPKVMASRCEELLSCPMREPVKSPLYPALLSPLRTSAVRSALANATGETGVTEQQPQLSASEDFSSEKGPHVISNEPQAVTDALPHLLTICREHSVPNALDADERQGLFDLVLSVVHILWGCAESEVCEPEGDLLAEKHCFALQLLLRGDEMPPLEELLRVVDRLTSVEDFKHETDVERMHLGLLLIQKWTGQQEKVSDEDSQALLPYVSRCVAELSKAHHWTVSGVLQFLSSESSEVQFVSSCVDAGHEVRASLLRLMISNKETMEKHCDPTLAPADIVTAVGESPKGRQFAALVNARSTVEQLQPSEWHSRLKADVDRLCAGCPPEVEQFLVHLSARLACRPCQSASLFLVAEALNTALPLSRRCLQQDHDPATTGTLLASLLSLSCAAPYQSLPYAGSSTVPSGASEVMGVLLAKDGVAVENVCATWKLYKARVALQGAASGSIPLAVLEGALINIVKWLLGQPPLSAPLEAHHGKINQVFAESADPLLREALGNSDALWRDAIVACISLLPKAGPSPFGTQLLTFAIASLEHPVGLDAQREVLKALLLQDADKLRSLVHGKAIGDEAEKGHDSGPFASMCKRWLCQVIAGSEELKTACRDCLLSGLPSCLKTDCALAYLTACAEVCAGGHERQLLQEVVSVLKGVVQAEDGLMTRLGPLLSMLEFVKASLATIVRVDSKGWFAQPASSLADALMTLKFCHRALRSSAEFPLTSRYLPASLATGPITDAFEAGYGCSFLRTKEEFSRMHWYLCYTSYPSEREGACGWCAEHLHRRRGYDVEYAGCIPAYCDTKGDTPIPDGCTAAPDAGGISPLEAVDPYTLALYHPPPSAPSEHQINLPADFLVSQDDICSVVQLMSLLEECVSRCLPECRSELEELAASGSAANTGEWGAISQGETWSSQLATKHLLHQDAAVVDSAVDGRLEYDALPHFEINLLQSRVLTRHVAASSLCGWVALVDRSQCVLIVDEAQSFPTSATSPPRRGDAKAELCVLSRNTVRFKIIGMAVHPANGVYLAVHGVHEVRVFVVSGGAIQSQLTPQLSLSSLSGSTHVNHCEWVPGSHTQLAVVTTKFVKVFDLAADLYCPVHNYMTQEGVADFVAASFARDSSNALTMFALTSDGKLFHQAVTEGDCVGGPVLLSTELTVPDSVAGDCGCSMLYSQTSNILCVGYTNGKAFLARWDGTANALEGLVCLPPLSTDRPLWSVNFWTESPDAPGVLACIVDDGSHVAVVSLDKQKHVAKVEVHELHGGTPTHVEGMTLARHRGVPSLGPSRSSRKQVTDTLNLVVSLENGTVCSYPLDGGKIQALQPPQQPERALHDVMMQKSAVITAKPIRAKTRRPGGKSSGREEREREREKDDAQEETHGDSMFEALLHGKQLPRTAPFNAIPLNTLRAMLAFEAKWGGPHYTRSGIPSTVSLNVWEDLTPLGRGAWSITRGVGVSAEDRDKLADGLDTTCISIQPPRALSRGPSMEPGVGGSPPLRGLSGSPNTSPCNSPPLSPLSQRSSPPAVGLSPSMRGGDKRSPGVVPLGPAAMEHRPAARFVLQATGDAVVCGLRLRLSSKSVKEPTGNSPADTSLSAAEDPVVMVRVASQTRTLQCDTSVRWLGFVLTYREALKTPKSGVEISIITNGPEVELRQVELFTSAAPPRRPEEVRPAEVPDAEQEIRERLRAREPTSPITSASSTLDAIIQNLTGRGVSPAAAAQRRRMEILEAREAQILPSAPRSHSPQAVAASTIVSPPPPPPVQPEEPTIGIHGILQSTLDCMRLALSVSPPELSADTLDSLWDSVMYPALFGPTGAAAERASQSSVAALHVLFASAGHNVRDFRKARAFAVLKLIGKYPGDTLRLQLATVAAYSTLNSRTESVAWLVANKDALTSLRTLVDEVYQCAQTPDQGRKGFHLTQDKMYTIAHLLTVLLLMAARELGDAAAEGAAMDRIVGALTSHTASSQGALYVVRQLMADTTIPTSLYAAFATQLWNTHAKQDELQPAFFNSTVCMVAKLAYPHDKQDPDIAAFGAAVAEIVPAGIVSTASDSLGLDATQYICLKSVALLAGASFAAQSVQLPYEKTFSEAEARCQDVMAAIATACKPIQNTLKDLTLALLNSDALPDLEVQNSVAGSETLLPSAPPVREQTRLVKEDSSDAAPGSALPPTSHDMVANTVAQCVLPVSGMQPLFAPGETNVFKVCKRHVLIACMQLCVVLHASGCLEDAEAWKAAIDAALRRDDLRFLHDDMTRVLTLCCGGSADACQDYRDNVGLNREFALLQAEVSVPVSQARVESLLKGYACLEAMTNIAVAHPRNWVRFCKDHAAIPFVVELLQGGMPQELAAHALRLLSLALRTPADLEGVGSVANTAFLLTVCEEYLLSSLPEAVSATLALAEPVGDARVEAAQLLKAVSTKGEDGEASGNAVVVFATFSQLLPRAASFGQAGVETLLKLILDVLDDVSAAGDAQLKDSIAQLATSFSTAATKFTDALLMHPRAPTYLAIEKVLGASKGSVLEGTWSQDCSSAQSRLSEYTLAALGADVKYSPDTIFVRLSSAIQLKRILMLVSDCKLSKVPRELEVWHSSQYTTGARAVRDSEFSWELLGRISVDNPAALCRATLELPLPVNTHALKLHFSSFHCDSAAQLSETLTCPSCNQIITDRHGQCLNCEYENAYQCRQCRNINHEQLDAFLCNECGWCRYGRVDFSLLCRQSLAPDVLRNESDRSRALQLLNDQNTTAHQLTLQLADVRTTASHLALQMQLNMARSASPTPHTSRPSSKEKRDAERKAAEGIPEGLHPSAVALAGYCSTSTSDINSQLAKSQRAQTALRKVIRAYTAGGKTTSASLDAHDDSLSPTDTVSRKEGSCEYLIPTHFGALTQLCVLFIDSSTRLLQHDRGTVQEQFLKQAILPSLYAVSLHGPEAVRNAARDLVVLLQEGSRDATEALIALMLPHLLPCVAAPASSVVDAPHIHSAAVLLSRCAACEDGLWHLRVPLLLKIFLTASSQVTKHPAVLEYVAKPALSLVTLLLTGEHKRVDGGSELAARYGRRWKAAWVVGRDPELRAVAQGAEWLVHMLLSPAAAAVAQQVGATVDALATPPLKRRLLRVLTESLSRAAKEGRAGGGCGEGGLGNVEGRVGGGAEPFFELFLKLLEPLWARVYIARKGFLPYVCKLLLREIYFLANLEGGSEVRDGDGSIPAELGWSVQKLAELLEVFVPAAKEEGASASSKQDGVQAFSKLLKLGNGVAMLLDASLTLKSVAAVRTKPITTAETLLKGILDSLVTESNADKSSFITASIEYLAKPRLPCQMGKHILEKVLAVVDPKPPEVVCQLLFKKKPSQEDFIRGSMGTQPVLSNTIGKTMGEVVARICRELDLQLDPDFGLELLVDSKIIDLSLPIQLVHDQVWKGCPSSKLGGSGAMPMLVVYRLQGLDGEATEERIDKLEEPEVVEDEPSVKYAVTECLSSGKGLGTLVSYVASVGELLRNREDDTTLESQLMVLVLTVLHHCCQVKVNRVSLAQQRSLQVMLSAVDTCAGKESDVANTALQLLLSAAGCIAGEMGAGESTTTSTHEDQHLEFCLTHLEEHYSTHSAHLQGVLSQQRTERKGLHKVCTPALALIALPQKQRPYVSKHNTTHRRSSTSTTYCAWSQHWCATTPTLPHVCTATSSHTRPPSQKVTRLPSTPSTHRYAWFPKTHVPNPHPNHSLLTVLLVCRFQLRRRNRCDGHRGSHQVGSV